MTAVYREVKALQEDLQKEGFYKGAISGRYDDATHEAVKAIVASGKLGDPVTIPDPAEDAYGKVVAAVAEEMKFSLSSAEAVRSAYSEWAREVQTRGGSSAAPLSPIVEERRKGPTTFPPQAKPQVLEDLGVGFSSRIAGAVRKTGGGGTGSASAAVVVQRLQTVLTRASLYTGSIDGKYTTPVELGFQKFAKGMGTTVAAILAGGANPRLNMNAADIQALKAARAAAFQAVAALLRALGPQGQAVVALQTVLRRAGLYAGALDGKYTAAVETAFQQWAARTGTTIEAYLASPGLPKVKQGVAAARAAAGFTTTAGTGTGAGIGTSVDTGKAVTQLQILLRNGGFISGEPDGIYEVNLEMAFGNWAVSTSTTIDAFLATSPGPLKNAIKQARDAYLASGGQAYPTGTGAPLPQQPPVEQQQAVPEELTQQLPPAVPTPADTTMPVTAEEVPPGAEALLPVTPELTTPVEVKTAPPAAPGRPAWQKWLIYGTIAAAIGGAAWWYWKKHKAAAEMMDVDDLGDDVDVAEKEECPCAREGATIGK